jgi:fucose permease
MHFFRSLAILSAISALICLGYWITDAATGMKFPFGWAFFSSILWALIFEVVHRYDKKKGRPKNAPKILS